MVPNPEPTPFAPAVLARHARTADAVLAFMPDCIDRSFVAGCPALKVVGCALKGYDNVDVPACTEAGVRVTYVPSLLTEPTAELAVGLLVGLGRNLIDGDRAVRDPGGGGGGGGFAGWRPVLYGSGLHGSTVGVAGFGKLGRRIATMLSGFGVAQIKVFDAGGGVEADAAERGCTAASLDEVLGCDNVVLALPLTPGTHHLVDDQVGTRCHALPGLFVRI